MIDNGAFADMRDGFSEELTEKYTGGKVDIVYKNAPGRCGSAEYHLPGDGRQRC